MLAKSLRSHSVLAALESARNSLPEYYDPGISIEAAGQVLEVPTARLQQINRRCMCALVIIFTHAMRASEYLRATTEDILGQDRLLIRGCKGSASYIVICPEIGRQFEDAAGISPARFVAGTTYRQLYAACVRIGLGDRVRSRENAARTHAARYRLAASLEKSQLKTAADCLRHRSVRSTIHYMPHGGLYHG